MTAPRSVDATSAGEDSSLLEELLSQCTFPPAGTVVTCAVSGGADSLSLLALARAADLMITVVHIDHGLRENSAMEADVVRLACERFGAAFLAERVRVEEGSDLEQRARQARYEVLEQHAASSGQLMTGHTADDQAETVLINVLRGAGSTGLAGMKRGFRHPILLLRRAETEALCADLGLEPVEDPSNQDPRFVRNRIRASVMPLLASISGRDPVPLLIRTSDHARQVDEDLALLADGLDPTNTREMANVPESLARHALRQWLRDGDGHPPSTAEIDRVLAVVHHQVIACEISGHRRVSRTDGVLRVESTA